MNPMAKCLERHAERMLPMDTARRSREGTVRALYAAYLRGRKDIVGAMLSEDFVFSSPHDDHISRDAYFDRCWPSPPPFRDIAVEYIAIEGDAAAVCYRAEKNDGTAFRNMEMLRFRGDRIISVDVYFGRSA
jgi:ketosteroid isomerase-like protein